MCVLMFANTVEARRTAKLNILARQRPTGALPPVARSENGSELCLQLTYGVIGYECYMSPHARTDELVPKIICYY